MAPASLEAASWELEENRARISSRELLHGWSHSVRSVLGSAAIHGLLWD
jgi:hypothetical protein